MITFILLGGFALLGIGLLAVAYSSGNRRRSGMNPNPSAGDRAAK